MAPLCTSAEVNLLIYHYLKESGFHHASFSLRHEARLDDLPLSKQAIVEPGQLIRYLQKGLIYAAVEAHVQPDGSETACSAPFRLIGPPHVCDGKPRPIPPRSSPIRLSPQPDPFSRAERSMHREAATQTASAASVSSSSKLTNGAHVSETSSASQSRHVSDDHNQSSKVASSSKKKLDMTEEGESTVSVVKTKDVKRKASTSVASDVERDDKRLRRDEDEPTKLNTPAAAEENIDGQQAVDDAASPLPTRQNGNIASRSASPNPERKIAEEPISRGNEVSNKKKKGGKSSAADGGDNVKKRDKEAALRNKDPKAPLPQPKGDNYIEDGQITTLSGHTGEVFISTWNPTVPNMLASGGGDATVRIWEVPEQAGELIDSPTICKHLPAAQSKDISTIDWNPDGTLLASGSYDGIVRLWTPQGDLHLVMSMHQGPVISVRWNRKGNMLLTGSADGTVIVWDLNSGKPRHTFPIHSDSVLDAEWLSTADGSLKGNSSSDAPPPLPHGLSLGVADTYFATCSADNSINICKLGEPKPIKSFKGHTDEVNAIRFDPSQTLLASVSDDNTAKIWALELSCSGQTGTAASAVDNLRKRGSQRRGGSAHLDDMDIEEDSGQRTTEESQGDREREKDGSAPTSATGAVITESSGTITKNGPASSPALGANGQSDTSASPSLCGSNITTTSKGPNKGLRLTLTGHTKELYALAWCPSGPGTAYPDQPRILATSSFDWTARLWNADSGECLRVIDGHDDNVYTLRFSPCARYLATGGIDKKVIISRVDSGAVVKQYVGGGAVFDLSWKDLLEEIPSTKQEEGSKDEASTVKPQILARRHQLAVSQSDRKLVVLNLSDLDSVEPITFFKRPAASDAKDDESTTSDTGAKKS